MKKQAKAASGNGKHFTVYHPDYGDLDVVIDKEDWPLVKKYKWFFSPPSNGRDAYIYTNVKDATGKIRRVKLPDVIVANALRSGKTLADFQD